MLQGREISNLLAKIKDYAETRHLPVVFAGDFNVTPKSPNYEYIQREGYKSAHEIIQYVWNLIITFTH